MKMLHGLKGMLNSRFGFVALALIFMAATLILILGVWLWDWKFGLPVAADLTARINTVVAVSAYMAVLVGTVVALVAYWQAAGRPVLVPEITLPSCPPNKLVFKVAKLNEEKINRTRALIFLPQATVADALSPVDDQPLFGAVVIKNDTEYAARNPGIRITFDGLYYTADIPQGWTIAETWPDQFTKILPWPKAIQWDGGVENIVHGKWSRTLPGSIAFPDVIFTSLAPRLIVTVVADGCRPHDWPVPIELIGGP